MPTQMRSHAELQQPGSTSHTRSQHLASLHAGMPFGSVHSPEETSPHVPPPPGSSHEKLAINEQLVSQLLVQQNGSMMHTASQHLAIEHEGVGFGMKQLPAAEAPQRAEQSKSACDAHELSHSKQQMGSSPHTNSQHTRSVQPGPLWPSRQSPILAGHSCACAEETMAPWGKSNAQARIRVSLNMGNQQSPLIAGDTTNGPQVFMYSH